MTGIVRRWDRGFGKITGSDRRSYFVHQDELVDLLELKPGQRVQFEPCESARGPRASTVRVIEPIFGRRAAP